jgi:hypothetical protein
MTACTKFDIGQTWALTFYPLSRQSPPHIEDVIVTQWKQLDPEPNLREILLEQVTPWQGGPNQLFGGYLKSIMNTDNTFISERDAFPYVSMGYWLPDAPLIKWHDDNNRLCYRYYGSVGELKIDYTGFAKPVFKVVEQTLVHVALHPWWSPSNTLAQNKDSMVERRCYLYIAGWYM